MAGRVAVVTGAGSGMGRATAHLFADCVEQLGPPDILVNNAGISLPAPIDGLDFDEQWATTLAVNLTAHTTTIRACLPHLTRHGEGRGGS